LPPLLGKRNEPAREATGELSAQATHPSSETQRVRPGTLAWSWSCTTVLLLSGLLCLWLGPPRFDRSPDALKPRRSEANAALDEIKKVMKREQEPLWVMVQG